MGIVLPSGELYDKKIHSDLILTGCNYDFFMSCVAGRFRGMCFEGGSRSGKTYSIAQGFATHVLEHSGGVYTFGRDHLSTFKQTVLMDLKEVFSKFGLMRGLKENKQEATWELNGNLVRFIGTNDDILKAYGLKQNYFWLNEAMGIGKMVFDQMEQRTEDGFWVLDYNPIFTKHWIYDLERRSDVMFFKTTVLDNPFLADDARSKILGYEPTVENIDRGTANGYMWKVFGLGLRASSDETVFREFAICDIYPEDYEERYYGLDFGFEPDPSAFVEVRIKGRDAYCRELLYENGFTLSDYEEALSGRIFNVEDLDGNIVNRVDFSEYVDVFCDSNGFGSSLYRELSRTYRTLFPYKGGSGSRVSSIESMKRYNLHIYKESYNMIEEVTNYRYKKLRDGTITKLPMDGDDHTIDALKIIFSSKDIRNRVVMKDI